MMPGLLCHNSNFRQKRIRETRAFCEGWEASKRGDLVGTNPYDATPGNWQEELAKEWTAGWNLNQTTTEGVRLCCVSDGAAAPD